MGTFDIHVHTVYSKDSPCTVKEAIEAGKDRGLDGIAITDHDSIGGVREAKKISKNENFLIIPGIEVSSSDGDILGLGVENLIPKGLSAVETVEIIRKRGGIAIAAHPFSPGLKPFSPLKAKFDAIEVLNSRRYLSNSIARKFAEKKGLPMVAGSDAHFPEEVGFAGVKVNCKNQIQSILKELKQGKASLFGRTLPFSYYLRRVFYRLQR